MEQLLHYVWQFRLFPIEGMWTTDGQPVEVLDPGLHNLDQGPDFFNAKVRIGQTVWAGNVELHMRSSDWAHHGHQTDPAYDSIILHVATEVDTEVTTSSGKHPTQLQLTIPPHIVQGYETLCRTQDFPRCWRIVRDIPTLKAHTWMSALLIERLQERSERCVERLHQVGGDWEHTLFITLARNFGFGINGETMEEWATAFPLHAAMKHRDHLDQLEALFLGSAGLLGDDTALEREWRFLAHKFGLEPVTLHTPWRHHRLRPHNAPRERLLQLARLFHQGTATFGALLHTTDRATLHAALTTPERTLSAASKDLIIINTIVPMLYAHGVEHQSEHEQDLAQHILGEIAAERNFIIRQWQECGLDVRSAADSQALIQLKRAYCDRHECLRCRFGYEYLKAGRSMI